jgi:hypothetical protein
VDCRVDNGTNANGLEDFSHRYVILQRLLFDGLDPYCNSNLIFNLLNTYNAYLLDKCFEKLDDLRC